MSAGDAAGRPLEQKNSLQEKGNLKDAKATQVQGSKPKTGLEAQKGGGGPKEKEEEEEEERRGEKERRFEMQGCLEILSLSLLSAPSFANVTAIHAGADMGACGLLLAATGAFVFFFEPFKSNYELIHASLKANHFDHNALLVPAGLGAFEGQVELLRDLNDASHYMALKDHDDDASRFAPLRPSQPAAHSGYQKARVDQVVLDGLVAAHVTINVMSLHLSGYEYDALLGARNLLMSRNIKVIKSYLHLQVLQEQDISPSTYFSLLFEANFLVFLRGKTWRPQEKEALVSDLLSLEKSKPILYFAFQADIPEKDFVHAIWKPSLS